MNYKISLSSIWFKINLIQNKGKKKENTNLLDPSFNPLFQSFLHTISTSAGL